MHGQNHIKLFELFVWSLFVLTGFSHVLMAWFYTCISHSWKKAIDCTTGSVFRV